MNGDETTPSRIPCACPENETLVDAVDRWRYASDRHTKAIGDLERTIRLSQVRVSDMVRDGLANIARTHAREEDAIADDIQATKE